jgi:hypothetical protein
MRVIAEVKSFDTWEFFSAVGARSQADVLKPHRRKIREAAGQLKQLSSQNVPLVVVLANPRGCAIPLEPISVMAAMYGDLTAWFPVYEDGREHEPDGTIAAGLNGKLRNDHQYISAVAVLQHHDLAFEAWSHKWFAANQGNYDDTVSITTAFLRDAQEAEHSDDVYLHVFETISPTAKPLPRDVFNGPHDRRWVPNADRTALVPLTA